MTHDSRRRPRALLAVAVVAAASALTACGLATGGTPSTSQLLVTTGYGSRSLVETDSPKTGGSDSVVDLLERNARGVLTGPGGAVRGVAGVGGAWTPFVNGVAPKTGPGIGPMRVRQGDRVWWDGHPARPAAEVRAVVGQYPEPFLHGIAGRRLPTRVECVDVGDPACGAVADKLVALGLPAAKGDLAHSFVQDTLRILVGPWRALRADATAALLERGPGQSGVFARPAPDGRSIALLDARGRTARTVRAGSGLIAATSAQDTAPVWIVTGTDERGIQAAAAALDEGALAGHFAVAVLGGRPVALPDGS